MSFSLIYTKTAKGAEEVRARTDSISTVARRLLIMIDGKRSESELKWVVRDGQLESTIAELLAQGLIEECGLAELPESEWGSDEDATVAMEQSVIRLDFALGGASAVPPPPPTLRVAVDSPAQKSAAPVARSTTIVIRPEPPRPPPAAAPAPASAPAQVSLEDAKRAAVRALYERLGPYGEEPAARIQDCKSLEALREQIRHACKRIVTFRGEPAAREYLAAIGMR